MAAGILYDLATQGASFSSAEASTPTMPIGNLTDPQPRRRVRLTGAAVSVVADFGIPRLVDCFGVICTTLTGNATIRARLGTVLGTWPTDTGVLAAEAQDAAQGNVILTLAAPVTARYLRLDIADAPAFTDIGLCIAGALWRVQRGTAYGITEGRVMLDRRDRNPFTGAEFPVPAIANPRYCAFTLPSLSTAEARTQHRDLVQLLGAARDGLVIPELNDSLAERNRRAIWGAINLPGEDAGVSRDSLPLSSRSFRVTERL